MADDGRSTPVRPTIPPLALVRAMAVANGHPDPDAYVADVKAALKEADDGE